MARRKRQRMHTREQRLANQRTRLPMPQEARDRALILSGTGLDGRGPRRLAEAWASLRHEPEPEAYELELLAAIEREYQRTTGRPLTTDEVDGWADADEWDREAAELTAELASTRPVGDVEREAALDRRDAFAHAHPCEHCGAPAHTDGSTCEGLMREREQRERPTADTDPGECRWCLEEAYGHPPCPYHGEAAQERTIEHIALEERGEGFIS